MNRVKKIRFYFNESRACIGSYRLAAGQDYYASVFFWNPTSYREEDFVGKTVAQISKMGLEFIG